MEMIVAFGQLALMPAATASVILRFVCSSSSRVGSVPSGFGRRGTPAVLITSCAPARTS